MVSGASRRYIGWLSLACAVLLAVSGCSNLPGNATTQPSQASDPIEPLNRVIYRFNYVFDGLILRPVTSIYRGVVPEQGRTMVSNALGNIYTPVVFANSVLQGDPKNSFTSLWRFLINSTVGIGGVFDVASDAGLKARPADLGQTFAMYGAGPGPYVVLPVIGPSNARDAFGRLGDAFMDPFNYINTGTSIAIWSATAVDKRSDNMKLLDDIYRNSIDPYATLRSGYTQKRAEDVRRGLAARKKAVDNGFCHSK